MCGQGNAAAAAAGLALQALTGTETIRGLAAQHAVSRKFIYQQVDTAKEALQEAFVPEQDDAREVLFYLPVTKQWLEQAFLGLALICHSPIRGISEFCRDLLDYPVSIGKVHNVLQGAVEQARAYNRQQDLSGVRIGAHDEIFQSGWPVLVGADVRSSFCYLLSLEEQRDAETWAIRMLELQDRGFRPEATIADAGSGLRAGQALAMPGTPCRGDVFHALQLVQPLATFLENRAYEAIAHEATLAHKSQKARKARTARAIDHAGTPCRAKRALPNNFALPPRPKPRPSIWPRTWPRCSIGCVATSSRWPVPITPRVANCTTLWWPNCGLANRFAHTALLRSSAP